MKKKLLALCVSGTMLIPEAAGMGVLAADTNAAANTVTTTAVAPIATSEQSSILKKDEIEKLVRQTLKLSDTYKLSNATLSSEDNKSKKYWNLNFNDSTNGGGYITAKAFADTGVIFSYDSSDQGNNGNVMKVLPDNAKKAAVDFIQMLQPDKFKETVEVTPKPQQKLYKFPSFVSVPYYTNDYRYMFVRKLGGEVYTDNYLSLSVSPYSGKVTSFDMKWEDASYTPVTPISEEEAIEKFKAQDNFSLKYVTKYKYNSDLDSAPTSYTLIPVYAYNSKDSGKINAVSGKLYKSDEIYQWDYRRIYYATNNKAEASFVDAKTVSGMAEMIPETGAMSREKAQDIIMKKLKNIVNIGDVKIRNSNYYKDRYTQDGLWNLNLSDDTAGINITGTVDSKNGKVTSLYYGNNGPVVIQPVDKTLNGLEVKTAAKADDTSVKPVAKLNDKETTEKLNGILTKIFPEIKSDEYKLTNNYNDKNIVSASSVRYIHNIPYDGDNISITYDFNKNVVTDINFNWDQVKAEYPSKLLTKDEAAKVYFDKLGLDKYLVQLNDPELLKNDKIESPLKECALVYSVKQQNFSYIDAGNGKFLDYNGNEYKEAPNANDGFTDIDNSQYKNEITLMNKMGLLQLDSSNFNPSGDILKKDAVKWIVLMANNSRLYNMGTSSNATPEFKDINDKDPYYTYVNQALSSGIIDNGDKFNGDSKVTKEDITKMFINALGLKNMAQYTNMFKAVYSDSAKIKADFTGYAALAKYNNIFGDKNQDAVAFDGDKTFTRGEFVAMIYNYLANSNK